MHAHDALAVTDEIYEHIIFDGARHLSDRPLCPDGRAHDDHQRAVQDLLDHRLAAGLRDRFERLTGAIRKVHDFLTVGAPHPLQEAGAAALALPESFYAELARCTSASVRSCLRRSKARGCVAGCRRAPTTS